VLDIIVLSEKNGPLLHQSVLSILKYAPISSVLTIIVQYTTQSVLRNSGIERFRSPMNILIEDDVYVQPGAFEKILEALNSDLMVGAVVFEDMDENIPIMAIARGVFPELRFDESYTDSRYCTLDFIAQIERRGLKVIRLSELPISHAPHKEVDPKMDNFNKMFFEEKWRRIRMGESVLLNHSGGY